MTAIAAIIEVMREVGSIPKSSSKALNYQFRGIDAMLDVIAPAMRKHGLVALPSVRELYVDEITVGRQQTKMGYARLTVEYRFCTDDDPRGVAVVTSGEAMDSSDKAINKALTQAFKNALWQTLCIPTGDPDPDAERTERGDDSLPEWTTGQRDAMARLQSRFGDLPSDFYAKAVERITKKFGRPVTKLDALGPLSIPWLDGMLDAAEKALQAEQSSNAPDSSAPDDADGDDDGGGDDSAQQGDEHLAES